MAVCVLLGAGWGGCFSIYDGNSSILLALAVFLSNANILYLCDLVAPMRMLQWLWLLETPSNRQSNEQYHRQHFLCPDSECEVMESPLTCL